MKPLPNSIEIWIIVTIILAFLLPIILVVIWKKRTGSSIKPFIVGAIIFLVFTQVFEGVPKLLFFGGITGVSKYVLTHTWAYVFLGCLLAGVFEEVGRFVAFRFFLKKDRKKITAISYGIGHGGIESIVVVGAISITYLMMFLQLKNGTIDTLLNSYPEAQRASMEGMLSVVQGYGPMTAGSNKTKTRSRCSRFDVFRIID